MKERRKNFNEKEEYSKLLDEMGVVGHPDITLDKVSEEELMGILMDVLIEDVNTRDGV